MASDANIRLLNAAQVGDLDAVKTALSNEANIEAVDWLKNTALIVAAKSGRKDVVEYLIRKGANIEAQNLDGWTALKYAANDGHDQVVNVLLSNGANVNTQSYYGWTALMSAANNGHDQIVNILLYNRANVDTQDINGETALDLANKQKYPGPSRDYPTVLQMLSDPSTVTPILTTKDVPKLKTSTSSTEADPPTSEIDYTNKDFEELSNNKVLELVDSDTLLGQNDLSDVYTLLKEVSVNWEEICKHIHVKESKIMDLKISHQSQKDCLKDALADWLTLNYSFQTHGKPTWKMIVQSVVRVNKSLSLHIASLHTKPATDRTAHPGEKVTLTIDEFLKPPFSFQWSLKETLLSADNPDYEGLYTSTLIIKECLSKHKGQYDCIVASEDSSKTVYHHTKLKVDGTVIGSNEARLLGRILQTKEAFKSNKSGINTEKLVNGTSDQPLEELQILLRRDTSTLADNLLENLTFKVEEERQYHEALKNDLKLQITYLKMIGLGPPRIGKSTFFARLEEVMKWDLTTAQKDTLPSRSTAQVESRMIGISKKVVTVSHEGLKPVQNAHIPGSGDIILNNKTEVDVPMALPDEKSQTESFVVVSKQTQRPKITSDTKGATTTVISQMKEYASDDVFVSSHNWHLFEGELGLKRECAHIYKHLASNTDSRTVQKAPVPIPKTVPSDSNIKNQLDDAPTASQIPKQKNPQNENLEEVPESSKRHMMVSMAQYLPASRTLDPNNIIKIKVSEIDELFLEFENFHHDIKDEVKDLSMIISRHDSGGQPAFLEMLPALTTGPAMYLIFSSLVQELRKQHTVKFRSEGEEEDSLCPDYAYTPEEVLFTALASIEAFGLPDEEFREYITEEDKENTQKKDSVTILLGTFEDEANKAEIDIGLEKCLREQLPLGNGLVEYNKRDPPKILFHVNNFDGGEEEVKWYQAEIKEIIEKCLKKYNIPARWFMLGMCLKFIALKKKKWMVSIDDCLEIGKKLEMNEIKVMSALKFLHKYIGLVMYFPSAKDDYLSKHVICNPQVVFSSMSEQIFKVYSPNKKIVNEKAYKKFKEEGLLTYSKSEKTKSEAEKHSIEDDDSCEEGLLTFNSLMKLLAHLNIVAPVIHSASVEYFLPAILKAAPESDLKLPDDWNEGQSFPEPLIIKFKTYFLPLGLFCALIAKLYSTDGYDMIPQYRVRKNMITFRTDKNIDVTLISWPRFCEVRIHSACDSYSIKEFNTCCPEIREQICAAINDVIKTMSHCLFSNASKKYFLGFKCPHHEGERLGHESIARIEIVDQDNVPKEMVCSDECNQKRCKVRSNLSIQHTRWYAKPTCPNITCQNTMSQKVRVGEAISLTVTAEGSSPLTYHWTRNLKQLQDGIHYSGSSTNCLHIKQAHVKLSGQYNCRVSNKVGEVTSAPTSLIIADLQFSTDFDCEELVAWLKQKEISSTGLQLFRDQMINGKCFVRLPTDRNELVNQLDSPKLPLGTKMKLVELITEARKVITPSISSQPASVLEVEKGKDISLTVTAEGSSPLTYQWTKDGQKLEDDIRYDGLSSSCLLIKEANIKDMGKYCCIVSNRGGQSTSAPTNLIIADLKFSIDFNCEELVVWLKQKGIPGEDLEVFKNQNINGKSFLHLPRKKKVFSEKLECSWTFGGWQTFVELMGEFGVADGPERRGEQGVDDETLSPQPKRHCSDGAESSQSGEISSKVPQRKRKSRSTKKHDLYDGDSDNTSHTSGHDEPSPAKKNYRLTHQGGASLLQVNTHLQPVWEAVWEVQSEWKNLGRALKIPNPAIKSIADVDNQPSECLYNVLEKWMQTGKATIHDLLKALEHVTVDRKDIADNIRAR